MAHQPLAAILGLLVGVAAEEGCDLRLDGLRQQRPRTLAQNFGERVGEGSWLDGSVRARASKYNLCSRTGGDVPSRGFQDGQHRHGAAEELESAAIGGNVLMMARARAEEVAEFVVCATEPSR